MGITYYPDQKPTVMTAATPEEKAALWQYIKQNHPDMAAQLKDLRLTNMKVERVVLREKA